MNQITFTNQESTTVTAKQNGETILETALQSSYPIFHECGGKARCTTCRIQIIKGLSNVSERNEREKLLARRKGWDETIRLACQTEVYGDIHVRKIIESKEEIFQILNEPKQSIPSEEIWLVVLFIDLKGFTEFSEKNYPHDIVHVLNRFFTMATEIILNNGGQIDKYIGDSVMAYYNPVSSDKDEMVINALRSCFRIQDKMMEFNEFLQDRFQHTFNIRMGIHSGKVVMGEVGHPISRQVTIFGDTVNVASRIESLNKVTGTNLLISKSSIASFQEKLKIKKRVKAKLRGKKISTVLVREHYRGSR
ncbi:adenylate/guanylate cyclase domain-containing protein [Leptospira brenneri]|uniref:adenylate/guanylate cyclase domain-containing protein n=1 Tax=Leptospira brenneri TaxID=2023182 RepID=UPI000C299C8F|nr:adenylate/guanylate cyclase domain-containing protein [Leptospira brenneri]PJZ43682.1 hypothetical protein CH361_19080 [Leptospira brenneri]